MDLADKEVRSEPYSTLQSSMCNTIARLLGVSQDLQEFDRVRSLCKRKGKRVLPVELQRYQSFIRYFRKQITTHKRALDHKLSQLAPSSIEYSQCAKQIKFCLQLICSELF